jgi:CheY-like chemotaxis protein
VTDGESQPDVDGVREDLEEIKSAAARAASLTQQLLAFSRQQVVEPRIVVLEEVVASSEKMLQRVIGDDVSLVTLLGSYRLRVMIDPQQLVQVIMNLAINARDAMPRGGKLTIETTPVELDQATTGDHWPAVAGRFAMLAVSDTGLGMDDETRARIFEPFFTTKEFGKGTGLGLATAYGIVRQSGGFIEVYSAPGQGTTFKIYLPRMDLPPTPVSSPVQRAELLHGFETVLLIDHSPGVRAAARLTLERYGYRVIEVANGITALAAASDRGDRIDLLLTDVVMPDMSWRDLAERLTAMRPGVKVLVMSGYADDAVLRQGVNTAGVAYLQKPFSPLGLASRVRELLDSPGGVT